MATTPVTKTSSSVPDWCTSRAEIGDVLKAASNRLGLEFQKIFEITNTTLNHPDVKAGLELLRRLQDACDDETIKGSPKVLAIAKNMLSFLSDASIGADMEKVFSPLTNKSAKDAISNDKRRIAASKNAKQRAWVLKAWDNRTDKQQGKAAFSRVYAPLVKSEFDLLVTADTIARDWLPKEKSRP